jgi:hypothetical protein
MWLRPHDSGYVAHLQFTVMWLTRTFTGPQCGSPTILIYVAHPHVLICVAPPADSQVVLHVLIYDAHNSWIYVALTRSDLCAHPTDSPVIVVAHPRFLICGSTHINS